MENQGHPAIENQEPSAMENPRHPAPAARFEHRWDPERDFLWRHRQQMKAVRRGDHEAYAEVKKLRVAVFRNTVGIVTQGHYVTEHGTEVTLPDDTEMRRDTTFYADEIRTDAPPCGHPTFVTVRSADCLRVAEELLELGYNPAVLNMASRRNPGGGVLSGAGAQEESLFRRSNLYRSLCQFAPDAERYGLEESPHQYPLDRNFGGIYTPGATVFRRGERSGYALMEQPLRLSFISVAGLNRPELTEGGTKIADHLVGAVKNKIRTIFRIGLVHGHDALVLSALGCGAFRNPPRHVARLFHEVMDEPEFKDRYRHIAFAILDDHNAHRGHNPEGNFRPFADEFAGCEDSGYHLMSDM